MLLYLQSYLRRRRSTGEALRRELVTRIREMGGIRPSNDFTLPPSVVRRASRTGLDEMADMLGYESDQALYDALMAYR